MNTFAAKWAATLMALLICCVGSASGQKQPVAISVSISCTHDTPSTYMDEYQKAPGARPEVKSTECVDMRESISHVTPSSVEVEYATPIKS